MNIHMKKITLLLGIVVLMSTTSVYAQSGELGEELFWKLENDTLTISGNGDIPNFTPPPFSYPPPWCDFNIFRNLVIENGVTSIGEFAFSFNKMLTFVSIANTVRRIGKRAFTDSALPSIVVPNSVTSIGDAAFSECNSLISITLPNKIIEFGNYVFNKCTKLTSITNPNPVPYSINSLTFGYLNLSSITLYVPKNSVSAYKKAPVWKDFNIVGVEGLDIDEIDNEEGGGVPLLIYPNPTMGTCSIIIPKLFQNEKLLTLFIYDNSGKLVQQITIDNENTEYSLKIDNKAAGVNMAVLSDGKRSVRGKIVFN